MGIHVALARPEAPPATNYGVPDVSSSFNAGSSFGGNLNGNGAGNLGGQRQGLNGGGNGIGNIRLTFAGQYYTLVPVNGGSGVSGSTFNQGFGGSTSSSSFSQNSGSGLGGVTGSSQGSSGGFESVSGSSQGSIANGSGKIIITKDVYVHVPPPEDAEEFEGGIGGGTVKRKHYKIIFIKAPSVSIEQQLALQSAAGGEEKTIVYVLVKKPELSADLEVARNQLKNKNKPEVYFVKYNGVQEEITGVVPPGNTYVPSKTTVTPPVNTYVPSKTTVTPPDNTYIPPHENEGPYNK